MMSSQIFRISAFRQKSVSYAPGMLVSRSLCEHNILVVNTMHIASAVGKWFEWVDVEGVKMAGKQDKRDPQAFVRSLARGLAVIEALGRSPGRFTLAELAAAAEINRA